MLKEYTISDFLERTPEYISCHVSSLERLVDSRLKWPHRHAFYAMIWFVEGRGFNVIDSSEYVIIPYRMFLITPEQVYNWTYLEGCKGYILMLDKALVGQLGIKFSCSYIDVDARHVFLVELVIDHLLRRLKSSIGKENQLVEITLLYLYSFITDVTKDDVFDTGGLNALLQQFKELILAGEMNIQSVDVYADALHVSTMVLNKICKDLVGCSAKQFLLDLKFTEAKRLLIYSQLNISAISYQLGFEDPSYFARVFRKKTLLTPTAFLRKYRK